MSADPGSDLPLHLAEARDLTARREWRTLADRAASLSRERMLEEPELGYLCANAWIRVAEVARALELIRVLHPRISLGGDRRLSLQSTNLYGSLLFESGATPEAEQRFGELLDRATEWKDDEFAARASNNLGVLANVRGRREEALTCYQRALASYQRLGHVRGLAQTHYNLGVTYRELRFADEADAHYTTAIRHAEQSGTEDVIGLAESDRALLCVQTGDPRMAEALARRARERFERLGDPVRAAEATRVLAATALASGRPDEARRMLEGAIEVAASHSNLLLLAELHHDLGLLLRDAGESSGARDLLLRAADHFDRLGATASAEASRELADAIPH